MSLPLWKGSGKRMKRLMLQGCRPTPFIRVDEQVSSRQILQFAVKQAGDCRKCAAPESQWIAKVIQPMLNLLEQLDAFASPSKPFANDRLGIYDM